MLLGIVVLAMDNWGVESGLKVLSIGGVFYKMLSTPQMDWLLRGDPRKGGFGWGRGCREVQGLAGCCCQACYEVGKEKPEDCNVIFAVAKSNTKYKGVS